MEVELLPAAARALLPSLEGGLEDMLVPFAQVRPAQRPMRLHWMHRQIGCIGTGFRFRFKDGLARAGRAPRGRGGGDCGSDLQPGERSAPMRPRAP